MHTFKVPLIMLGGGQVFLIVSVKHFIRQYNDSKFIFNIFGKIKS